MSVTENIDETPSGALLHGIMSSIAEFYSRNLANEVIKGTQQKVRAGGTPSRAPIGYQNVRKLVDGVEVRTVEVDPQRAALITWAFNEYATGEHTLRTLAEALRERGLTFRPGPKTPAREVPAKKLQAILRNRYYIGFVTWRGVEHEGKHPHLVDAATFDAVQRTLTDHRTSGERPSKRGHYLVGTVRCGGCGLKLLFTVVTGRNREPYGYFFCASRSDGGESCGQRYLPQALVEAAVEQQWLRETIPGEDLSLARQDIESSLTQHENESATRQQLLSRQIQGIKRERFKWAEKAMAGAIPDDIAAAKQRQLAADLLRKEAALQQIARISDVHLETLRQVMAMIERAGHAYGRADAALRRSMNHAWFEALYLSEEDGHLRVVDTGHNDLGQALRQAVAARQTKTRRQRSSDGADPVGVSNFNVWWS